MGNRNDFTKRVDARAYIANSVRKENENLTKLTNIFDDWGKTLCDVPKEELEEKHNCEGAWLSNFVEETITKCSEGKEER